MADIHDLIKLAAQSSLYKAWNENSATKFQRVTIVKQQKMWAKSFEERLLQWVETLTVKKAR